MIHLIFLSLYVSEPLWLIMFKGVFLKEYSHDKV